MKDPKYVTLLKILDRIRSDAPSSTDVNRRFHSKRVEDISFSRGQAFIHLFLLVKFGIDSFEERAKFITDGSGDGGLDAFYISDTEKTVYLIQAKFKNSETNFVGESIPASELVKIELDRILQGESNDSNGQEYNPQIFKFQNRYDNATRKQIFRNKIIFLANIKNFNDFQIRRITNNLDYEIYNFEKCYIDLVRPMCAGTYYDPDKIVIELDLSEKNTPQLSQRIKTSYGFCDITAVFVPTIEIGRVMATYKNAILKYNPRNYLGLSKNTVNKDIRKSIMSLNFNDFALLNNGITILAEEQEFTIYTGAKNVGRLTLSNPQIINGGQTAYTLSEVFQKEYKTRRDIFDGKEVLLRIVVLKDPDSASSVNKYDFMNAISSSTNQQTLVKVADRYSNNDKLIKVQDEIYRKYGYLVELKQGEYYDGKQKGYVTKEFVLDRIVILRSFLAFSGNPTPARRHAEHQLFDPPVFLSLFPNESNLDINIIAAEIFYSYKVHGFLTALERKEGSKALKYGYALRYGKYAVVYASRLVINQKFLSKLQDRSLVEIEQHINQEIPKLLDEWKRFEESVQTLDHNLSYFNDQENLTDFNTYYKGKTLKEDLESYFNKADK